MTQKCYTCKYRGSLSWSAHSCCKVTESLFGNMGSLIGLMISSGSASLKDESGEPMVKLNPHGVKNGWAMWPINFDPVWIEECKYHENKEEQKV